jgi:hypothetical protein
MQPLAVSPLRALRCAFGIVEVIGAPVAAKNTIALPRWHRSSPFRAGRGTLSDRRKICSKPPAHPNLTGETFCGLLREQRIIVKRGRTRPSQSSVLSFCRSRPMSVVPRSAPRLRAAVHAGRIPKCHCLPTWRVVMLAKIYLVILVALTMALGPPWRRVRVPLPVGRRDGRRRRPDARW